MPCTPKPRSTVLVPSTRSTLSWFVAGNVVGMSAAWVDVPAATSKTVLVGPAPIRPVAAGGITAPSMVPSAAEKSENATVSAGTRIVLPAAPAALCEKDPAGRAE